MTAYLKNPKRFLSLVLVAIVFLLFWGITKTFYQQDEWHGMGDILVQGPQAIGVAIGSPLQILLGRGRILGNIMIYSFFTSAPFDLFGISLIMLALHAANAVLLFYLAYKITKNYLAAFVGAAFFAVNAVSQGAITWPASGTATLPASFLIFLAIFFFFNFLQKEKKKWLYVSFLMLYLSLYFKETSMPFFVFFPLTALLFKKYTIKKFINHYWLFILFCVIAVVTRLSVFQSTAVQQDLFITGATKYPLQTIASRVFLYPITSFSLLYIPSEFLMTISKHVTWLYYPFYDPSLFDLIAQTFVMDIFSIIGTFSLLFVLFVSFQKTQKLARRRVIFFVLFILFSFLPYIIISKSYAYLESRYYYIAVFGAGVLVALLLSRLKIILSKKLFVSILIALLGLLYLHIKFVQKEIHNQVAVSEERVSILESIKSIKPTLSDKTVFLITGDKSYYISNANYIPMQQGVGYTLLVWYLAHNSAPVELKKLLAEYFLWEMDKQAYKEVDGKGFGYFWDKSEVEELIKQKKIKQSDVVVLFYKSHDKKLIDITQTQTWPK